MRKPTQFKFAGGEKRDHTYIHIFQIRLHWECILLRRTQLYYSKSTAKCPFGIYRNQNFATNLTAKSSLSLYTNPNFTTNLTAKSWLCIYTNPISKIDLVYLTNNSLTYSFQLRCSTTTAPRLLHSVPSLYGRLIDYENREFISLPSIASV